VKKKNVRTRSRCIIVRTDNQNMADGVDISMTAIMVRMGRGDEKDH
jgi:hypothetical protein